MNDRERERIPEVRRIDVAACEVRAESDAQGRPVIRGTVMKYGSMSSTLRDSKNRPFRECFRAGAFSRALATGADVRFLVNHNRDLVLGRNKSGTLDLADGPDGLTFVARPPKTAIGEHYTESVRRGDISGVSLRFYKMADLWTGAGEATVREVIEADLDDVSIVMSPAYPDSGAEVDDDPSGSISRSLDEHERGVKPARDPWLDSARVRLRLAETACAASPFPRSPIRK